MKEIFRADKAVKMFLPEQKIKANTDYKLSQFVYIYEKNNKHYLFNMLTRQCFESERAVPKKVRAEDAENDETLMRLIREHFLVPSDKDECSFYEGTLRLMRAYNKRKGFELYTILPTLACNARCVYCYEEGRKQVTMSRETVNKTIDLILSTRNKNRPVHLAWFGGEPLMCEGIIDTVCDALSANGVEYYSTMISNGSLINERIADKMAGKWQLKQIQISTDCGEEAYIRRKNYYRYDNYYRALPINVNMLVKRNITVTIRCNIDMDTADAMQDFIKDMDSAVPDKNGVGIYFVPLNEARIDENALKLWDMIFNAMELTRQSGFGVTVTVDPKNLKVFSCMADDTDGAIIIGADGSFYNCEYCEPGTSFGDLDNGITKPDILKSFANWGKTREKCRDCVFLPQCTGFSKCPIIEPNCKTVLDNMTRLALEHALELRAKKFGYDTGGSPAC